MKNVLISLLVILSVAVAQDNTRKVYNDTFTPSTLFAGTSMSARTAAISLADTTRAFNTRGYAAVYVGLETAGNDSANLLLQYRVSKDGTNFSAAGFVTFDSLVVTSGTGHYKYFALPANALGAYSAQVIVKGQAHGGYAANPVTTVTTKIIRIPYNDAKLK